MKFLEIETKYDASRINLKDFQALMQRMNPKSELRASGFDHYYTRVKSFIRYRAAKDRPELTMKTKSKKSNNYVRVEANLPLDTKTPMPTMGKIVEKICKMLGYNHNFSIWKSCFIYWFDKYNLVYYIVSDENMVERARFIEIEMSETHKWSSTRQAWSHLVKIEKRLSSLGIKRAARLSESLFEMFKK